MEYKGLNNGESAYKIRTKLNEMLEQLITGAEGVLSLWKYIFHIKDATTKEHYKLSQRIEFVKDESNDKYETLTLQMQTLTNVGGINGVVPSLDYRPNIPKNSSAIFIGTLVGNYTGFLSSENIPIKVDSPNTLVIMFKPPMKSYWVPTFMNVSVNVTDAGFGESRDIAVSQRLVTERFNQVESRVLKTQILTTLEYEQLEVKDPNTIYFLTEMV